MYIMSIFHGTEIQQKYVKNPPDVIKGADET